MTLGSRLAFAAWRLYRTNALARRVLTPRLARSGEKKLAAHDAFVAASAPSASAARVRTCDSPRLAIALGCSRDSVLARRIFGLLHHWRARYELVDVDESPGNDNAVIGPPGTKLEIGAPRCVSFVPRLPRGALKPGAPVWTTLDGLVARPEPRPKWIARVFGPSPIEHVQVMLPPEGVAPDEFRGIAFDDRILSPHFVASPWGSVLPDAIDWVLGEQSWREPLPPLVSARVDDVTGAAGLGWLAALEEQGIRPSIGTLHDEWLAAGKSAVDAIVAASGRGCSVSPHAFSMDRFIWFDAPRGCSFSKEEMEQHRRKLEQDAKTTGLRFGKTLSAHFDVLGETAVDAASALGFRFALGEHVLGQDWREAPRARDPLGTPLYAYGPLDPAGKLTSFQAAGAIASSAAPRSRYDWIRNFIELDDATGKPRRETLDRRGAVAQGVTQLLSALYAGFPAYLLAHEMHLDALGRELVGEILGDVLREVRERVPEIRCAPFDELPEACVAR